MATDLLDVLTTAEATAALSDGTAVAAEVEAYVTACSRWLDELVGPVVQRTVTSELHDGGDSSIWLRWRPCSAVTSVTEVGTLLSSDGWHAARSSRNRDWFSGQVWRKSGDAPISFVDGFDKVAVTYTAGRYADTASVDALYKDACRLLLQSAWATEQFGTRGFGELDVPSTTFRKFAVPNAVRQLMFGELKSAALGVAIA